LINAGFPPPWSVEELDTCFAVEDAKSSIGSQVV